MSRSIDLTKRLSAEDREYLVTRGRDDLIAQNDADFGSGETYTKIDDGNTGDIDPFTADDSTTLVTGMSPDETAPSNIQTLEGQGIPDLGDENKDPNGIIPGVPSPTQQAGDGEKDTPDEGSDAQTARTTGDDEDGDNYDDASAWSYEDLKNEVKGRKEEAGDEYDGPALNASREDLVSWLRTDDQR